MKVLTLYIAKDVLKASAVALAILLALFNLFTLSDELDDIGKGDYGLVEVLYFLILTSPTVFYELMPYAALLGSLFALGSLANQHELTAMRAAGLSVFGIIRAVMLAGAVLAVAALAVGEFVAPEAEEKAQLIRATALNKSAIMRTKYGLWLREGERYINVRRLEDDGSLSDISIYETSAGQGLRQSLHADQALFLGGRQWRLQGIKQSKISPEQITAESSAQQIWDSSIAPDLLKIVLVNPDNLGLSDLATYIRYSEENHQKSQRYQAAFWGRIVNPLVIFVMLLISTPFVIGIRRGIGTGARILGGTAIGLAFNIIDMNLNNLGLVYNLNPILMAFGASLLVASLALVAIKRLR
jgi:lipopolysaccharide export system permease protein